MPCAFDTCVAVSLSGKHHQIWSGLGQATWPNTKEGDMTAYQNALPRYICHPGTPHHWSLDVFCKSCNFQKLVATKCNCEGLRGQGSLYLICVWTKHETPEITVQCPNLFSTKMLAKESHLLGPTSGALGAAQAHFWENQIGNKEAPSKGPAWNRGFLTPSTSNLLLSSGQPPVTC